jgi:hypothetical protein
MKCETCKSEIDDGALICPHCRQKTESGRWANTKKIWTWVGIAFAGFFLFILIGNMLPGSKPVTGEDIRASCERQFGPDIQAVNRCDLELSLKELERREGRRMDAAASDAGVER